MPQPIVLQLQELASDNGTEITELLRKALIVATKLSLLEFKVWVLSELNGYSDSSTLPKYRLIKGDVKVHNPVRGLIPFMIKAPDLQDLMCRVRVTDSVSSIQHLMDSRNDGAIVFYFSAEQEAALMRAQGEYMTPLRPVRVVGANQLLGILQTVRTSMLEWALSLEAEGILGDGLSFSIKEKERAVTSKSINIENFQGVLGDVHGGTVSQTNTMTISAGNFGSLATYLEGQGITKHDISQLQDAIRLDLEPRTDKKFGASVSAWIGRMISLAASGSWEVSVATAGTLLGAALAKFYGF